MKNLILVLLLATSVSFFAQSKVEKSTLPAAQRIDLHVNALQSNLKLDADQTAKVKELITANVNKREARITQIKTMRTDGAKRLSEEEKALLANEISEKEMATKEQMKAILTAEQYSKWEAHREKYKVKTSQKREAKKAEKMATKQAK